MAEYSVPKKDPYVIKVKAGNTVSSTLKDTTARGKKAIEESARKFELKNIRKGW
jgi:hypothetical protein